MHPSNVFRMITLVLVVLPFVSGFAYAQETVPRILKIQGRITESDGQPIADGIRNDVVFTIYDAATGGNILWQSAENSATTFDGGVFTRELGNPVDNPLPIDLFSMPEAWLGIKVGADPEATPRQRIVAAAYAIQSEIPNFEMVSPDSSIELPATYSNNSFDLQDAVQLHELTIEDFRVRPGNQLRVTFTGFVKWSAVDSGGEPGFMLLFFVNDTWIGSSSAREQSRGWETLAMDWAGTVQSEYVTIKAVYVTQEPVWLTGPSAAPGEPNFQSGFNPHQVLIAEEILRSTPLD